MPLPRIPPWSTRPSRRGGSRWVVALAAAALLAVTARPARADPPDGVAPEQPPMLRCLLPALIPDVLSRCFSGTNPSYRTYAVLSASFARDTREVATRYDFTDLDAGTPHVTVAGPALVMAVEGPKGLWGVNASIVAAFSPDAPPDILTSATKRYRGARYVPSVGGHGRFGDVDVNLRGSLSYQRDVHSMFSGSAGGGVSIDLLQKTVVPSLDYTFAYDLVGRSDTPYSLLAHRAYRHTIEARTSIMLDEATLFLPMLAVLFEQGDTSAFFRRIPLFSAGEAQEVPAGATASYVNSVTYRPSVLERLPTKRLQVAPGVLFVHRFAWSTLRVEERFSADSWTVMSTSTSVQWVIDAGARVRLWPDVRVHAQRGADFWRLTYVIDSDGRVPLTRTARIDLGPLVTLTSGAGVRVALDEGKRFSVIVNGGFDYTRFLDHLYVTHRIGPFGTVALEADVH